MAEQAMEVAVTKLRGWYDIFPISDADPERPIIDLPAWRWMVIMQWYEPGDEQGFPRMLCRRHPCPLKLMRWVCLHCLRIVRQFPEARA